MCRLKFNQTAKCQNVVKLIGTVTWHSRSQSSGSSTVSVTLLAPIHILYKITLFYVEINQWGGASLGTAHQPVTKQLRGGASLGTAQWSVTKQLQMRIQVPVLRHCPFLSKLWISTGHAPSPPRWGCQHILFPGLRSELTLALLTVLCGSLCLRPELTMQAIQHFGISTHDCLPYSSLANFSLSLSCDIASHLPVELLFK